MIKQPTLSLGEGKRLTRKGALVSVRRRGVRGGGGGDGGGETSAGAGVLAEMGLGRRGGDAIKVKAPWFMRCQRTHRDLP